MISPPTLGALKSVISIAGVGSVSCDSSLALGESLEVFLSSTRGKSDAEGLDDAGGVTDARGDDGALFPVGRMGTAVCRLFFYCCFANSATCAASPCTICVSCSKPAFASSLR